MFLSSLFKGEKYFDKSIKPKCDYCRFGKRAKDGNKVLCEKKGLVDCEDSCKAFIYSPLKRIPVKQLNFVGSLADEELFIESASERAEREKEMAEAERKIKKNSEENAKEAEAEKKSPEPAPAKKEEPKEKPADDKAPKAEKDDANNSAPEKQEASNNDKPAEKK